KVIRDHQQQDQLYTLLLRLLQVLHLKVMSGTQQLQEFYLNILMMVTALSGLKQDQLAAAAVAAVAVAHKDHKVYKVHKDKRVTVDQVQFLLQEIRLSEMVLV
ncbi:MAG: hypothetical protein EBS89_00170, partial [Proteobacteria bacterium]|nr:hypothetical protein [Pseudomonadota bacterium]